jgi:hypothetical protein
MSENGKFDPLEYNPTTISTDGSLVEAMNKWQLGVDKFIDSIPDKNYQDYHDYTQRVSIAATALYNLVTSKGKLRKTIKIRRSILEPEVSPKKPKRTRKKVSTKGMSKIEKQVQAFIAIGFTEEQAKTKMREAGIDI